MELRGDKIEVIMIDEASSIDLSDFRIDISKLYPKFTSTSNHYKEPKTEWEELLEVL